MLAERLQAKLNRNYDAADAIQRDLLGAGVYVHDGQKEWRADGIPFGDLEGGRGPGKTRGSRSDGNRDYVKSTHSTDVEGAEEELITSLANERKKFKMMREFDKADAIRDGLQKRLFIDDRLNEWSVGGDFGEANNIKRDMAMSFGNRGYAKAPQSLPISAEDEEYIVQRIETRAEAKKDRDFDTADAIREELSGVYGVFIQDKTKMWWIGDADMGSSPRKTPGEYTRRGGGDLSDEDLGEIQTMIKERFFAKKDRDFNTADEIRDYLRNTYSISLDDRSKEWRVDTDEYAQVLKPGCIDLPENTVKYIESKISERHASKVARDYDIRDNLRENYEVVIDDRTKEWRCDLVDNDDLEDIPEDLETELSEDKDDSWNDELDSILSVQEEHSVETGMEGPVNDEEELDDDEEESDDLSSLTVVQLKEKLREAGLKVSGKKTELVERLSQLG